MALKLLVIENDEGIRLLIDQLLNPDDYEIVLAKDSKILDQIPVINPDVIFLDEWLCNENGSDLCRKLKENPLTASIPVILISAMMSAKEFYKKAGADGFIRKPFDLDELKLMLNQYS